MIIAFGTDFALFHGMELAEPIQKAKYFRGAKSKMETHDVIMFKPYPFKIGQKLNIEGGSRNGDWEVIGVSDRKVKLRCPISFREFEWTRFCYFVEEKSKVVWPNTEWSMVSIS